jgi:hypothetical protein
MGKRDRNIFEKATENKNPEHNKVEAAKLIEELQEQPKEETAVIIQENYAPTQQSVIIKKKKIIIEEEEKEQFEFWMKKSNYLKIKRRADEINLKYGKRKTTPGHLIDILIEEAYDILE